MGGTGQVEVDMQHEGVAMRHAVRQSLPGRGIAAAIHLVAIVENDRVIAAAVAAIYEADPVLRGGGEIPAARRGRVSGAAYP
jgi:hypothetical protein